ncbi:hypothetical protein MOPEL_007_00190 [Mobilicoccus pelagius NBRC 104925]|uniref:Uncharacterized protein n=1 Tax=Mobilicoccus pelagius NBRC 104925 TaxID=1089455 RepID=H5UN94_9MICO|nr:hypothetical protein MOPEL_007_00190 [Mobilicoccus pelagius NBRC 104925]
MTTTYPGPRPAPRPGVCDLHDREPLTASGTCPWCRAEALAATPPPIPGPLRPARLGELVTALPTTPKRQRTAMPPDYARSPSVRDWDVSRTTSVTNTTLTTEETR